MSKTRTRGRGRKKGFLYFFEGDPKELRFRERPGRNRSNRLKAMPPGSRPRGRVMCVIEPPTM